jgi:hypothetical protein
MKLDEWLTRLMAVPPRRIPLANVIAIGMRIAFFILVPLGIVAAIAILFSAPMSVSNRQAKSRFDTI